MPGRASSLFTLGVIAGVEPTGRPERDSGGSSAANRRIGPRSRSRRSILRRTKRGPLSPFRTSTRAVHANPRVGWPRESQRATTVRAYRQPGTALLAVIPYPTSGPVDSSAEARRAGLRGDRRALADHTCTRECRRAPMACLFPVDRAKPGIRLIRSTPPRDSGTASSASRAQSRCRLRTTCRHPDRGNSIRTTHAGVNGECNRNGRCRRSSRTGSLVAASATTAPGPRRVRGAPSRARRLGQLEQSQPEALRSWLQETAQELLQRALPLLERWFASWWLPSLATTRRTERTPEGRPLASTPDTRTVTRGWASARMLGRNGECRKTLPLRSVRRHHHPRQFRPVLNASLQGRGSRQSPGRYD